MTDKRSIVDDWANAVTGLGGPPDKDQYRFFQWSRWLEFEELDAMYESDAISARIVDRLPDDATREGFDFATMQEDFDERSLMSKLEDLKLLPKINAAIKWSRLYGGSLLVMGIDDGRPASEPVDMDAVRAIKWLSVVDSKVAFPEEVDPNMGVMGWRNPERYVIGVPEAPADQTTIHRSRVVRFDGVQVPPLRMTENGGWGPSALQRPYKAVAGLGQAMGYTAETMHMISTVIMRMTNFKHQICGGPAARADIAKTFESVRMAWDNLHMLVLDSEDGVEEFTRDVAGLAVVVDKFVDALVRATDMPRTILLGEQPAGLNTSADGEVRGWYDYVAAQQPRLLTPAINRVIDLCFAAQRNAGEMVPEEWTIGYPSLWQPTAKEQAETDKIRAETLTMLIDLGVATTEEVRSMLVDKGILEAMEAPNGLSEPS